MFPNNTQIPRIKPIDLRPQQRKPLPRMHQHTNKPNLRALGHRTEIRAFEIATHAAERELAGLGHAQEDSGRQNVDQRRRAPAVQVAHVVAEVRRDGEEVRGLRWGTPRCAVEAEVAIARVDVPVLSGWLVG